MNWMRYFVSFLALIFSFSSMGQAEKIITSFEAFHSATPFEKVYLHTDKEVYAPGEDLWLAAYLTNASTHLPSPLSQLVYVELLDTADQVLVQLPLKISEGVGRADIALGDSLLSGKYTIRGFTNYQRNFDPSFVFSKSIFLVEAKPKEKEEPALDVDEFDFQFFPEGGELIAEMPNHVGFKAVDSNGEGVAVEGTLISQEGKVITSFKSEHLGLGRFLYTPQKKKKYELRYKINGVESSLEVPMAREEGCLLSVRQTSSALHVSSSVSGGTKVEDCFIIGHVRGKVFVVAKPSAEKNSIYAMIPRTKLPNGIIHFTLFYKELPVQERLVFNENPTLLPNLEFYTENLGTRKRIRVEIDAEDSEGKPLNAKASISILGDNVRENQVTITSYLNLLSDLKGKVEEPGYYFEEANKDRMKHLDLLMMTQGWRRFTWSDVLGKELPPINYYAEKGFTIEGKVKKYYNRNKPEPSEVSLNFMENLLFKKEMKTEEGGNFWFEGLEIQDTVSVMLQAMKAGKGKNNEEKKRDKGTFIEVHEPEVLPNVTTIINSLAGTSATDYSKIVEEIDETTYSKDAIRLDDFTVSARRLDEDSKPFRRPGMLHSEPTNRLVADSVIGYGNFTNVFDAIKGRIPGVRIIGIGNEKQAVIRDANATFLFDGIIVDNIFVNQLDPQQVAFIDVLKGVAAGAVYGTGGSVIAIYSRTDYVPGADVDPKGMIVFTHNGYYQAKEFYTPNYEEMSAVEALDRDIRSTQYWSSIVDIEDGEADIEYFSSDNLGTFILYLEGITDSGEPFNKKFTFEIDK